MGNIFFNINKYLKNIIYKKNMMRETNLYAINCNKLLSKYEKNIATIQKEQEKNKMYEEMHIERINSQLSAVARELMKVKWLIIDNIMEDISEEALQCRICGYEAPENDFETKVSECQFNGGKLIRYICPKCGVIFGPAKFLRLSEKEIDDDYAIHYIGFAEGDSTEKEINAFYLLKPDKMKLYLNYGCGCWSKSLEYLRNEGYQVFGYEPHAPDGSNPYMITSRDRLKNMRFDGIYTNNVLEHLLYPVEEFRFMKSLLKSNDSKMAHSTPCYEL